MRASTHFCLWCGGAHTAPPSRAASHSVPTHSHSPGVRVLAHGCTCAPRVRRGALSRRARFVPVPTRPKLVWTRSTTHANPKADGGDERTCVRVFDVPRVVQPPHASLCEPSPVKPGRQQITGPIDRTRKAVGRLPPPPFVAVAFDFNCTGRRGAPREIAATMGPQHAYARFPRAAFRFGRGGVGKPTPQNPLPRPTHLGHGG